MTKRLLQLHKSPSVAEADETMAREELEKERKRCLDVFQCVL